MRTLNRRVEVDGEDVGAVAASALRALGVTKQPHANGAQQVIGNLCNFFNAIGLLIPPYATLSVLWERQAKSADPSKEELLRKYEADYSSTADRMIDQLLAHASSDRRGS